MRSGEKDSNKTHNNPSNTMSSLNFPVTYMRFSGSSISPGWDEGDESPRTMRASRSALLEQIHCPRFSANSMHMPRYPARTSTGSDVELPTTAEKMDVMLGLTVAESADTDEPLA